MNRFNEQAVINRAKKTDAEDDAIITTILTILVKLTLSLVFFSPYCQVN